MQSNPHQSKRKTQSTYQCRARLIDVALLRDYLAAQSRTPYHVSIRDGKCHISAR